MPVPRLPLVVLLVLASAACAARAEDCNGNGVDDLVDIVRGASADCQGDGIPDECQLEVLELSYLHDNGFGAQIGGVGTNNGPTQVIAWLAHHTVAPGREIVNGFQIVWGLDRKSVV